MKTAVAQGVREGLDGSRLGEMTQLIATAIRQHGQDGPTDPTIFERLDALEAARRRHDDAIEMIHTRLERHRRRIRWLERLAHWHGWFRPNPNP